MHTSQDVLVRSHIFASLHPDTVSEHAVNNTDGEIVTWEQV